MILTCLCNLFQGSLNTAALELRTLEETKNQGRQKSDTLSKTVTVEGEKSSNCRFLDWESFYTSNKKSDQDISEKGKKKREKNTMLRLRKSKLLPQQVSDLGAFIFVVAMIPVSTSKPFDFATEDFFSIFQYQVFHFSISGDLPMGGDCC